MKRLTKHAPAVSPLLLVAAIAFAGAGSGPLAAGETDHGRAGARTAAAGMSFGQVIRQLEAGGYRSFEEIGLKKGCYRVKATDRDGNRVALWLDPQTGKPGCVPVDASGKSRAREPLATDGRECTKRRCRDDQPAAPAAPSLSPAVSGGKP